MNQIEAQLIALGNKSWVVEADSYKFQLFYYNKYIHAYISLLYVFIY